MSAFKVLSWGCGVQSTALAVMSALGDMPRLDRVVFSDTGWERQKTYDTRDYYVPWLRRRGVDVSLVSNGDIRREGAEPHVHMPFWTEGGGPLRRQCTRRFKIVPVKHEVRRLLGFHESLPPHPAPGRVEQWLGISLDEYTRMKDSRVKYIVNRWPLVEARITRFDCVEYLRSRDLPVPVKSSCVGCPYRSASDWLEMKRESPGEWSDAISFDEQNRTNPLTARAGGTADKLYIYKVGPAQPLATADLLRDVKREHTSTQLPLFICDGGFCNV